jgi:cell wall-associated NlpC family hydrolase
LHAPGPIPTHKVTALRTFVFPGPSIKLPPLEALPFGARLAIARSEEPFALTAAGGYIPARHLVPIAAKETDFVAVAERFLGAPYLWGGKSALGIDCSGLVQVALSACGIVCPRDSDMQERALGSLIELTAGDVRRGDLLFWQGHVAIARDAMTLVHANAFHMAVASEPVTEALSRIAAAGGAFHGVRRLAPQ